MASAIISTKSSDRSIAGNSVYKVTSIEFFAKLSACLIGMEACPGAHHWARELMKLGHSVTPEGLIHEE